MMATDQTEEQADAAALLATVRHLMTGAEIDVCERIASGEPVITFEAVLDDNGEWVGDVERVRFAGTPTPDEKPTFDSLRLQFYAQICNHKDGRATA